MRPFKIPAPIPGTSQVPFCASKALMPAFLAATGTGKTLIGARKVIETCWYTGCDALIVTPDYKQNRRGPQEKYIPLLEPVAADSEHVFNENRQSIRAYNALGGISEYWFASGVTSKNLFGGEVGIVHLDEVCLMDEDIEVPAESPIFRAATTRARQPLPQPWTNQVIVTGTPETVDHWSFKMWGDPSRTNKEDTPRWCMSLYENPYRTAESIKLAEMATRGNEAYARQLLHGEWLVRKDEVLFREEWFPTYEERPDNLMALVGSWDTAGTTHEWSSYTVGQIWGLTADHHYFLLDMVREKLDYPLVKVTIRDATRERGLALNLIENKQTGQPAIQELSKEGLRIAAINPGRDKQDRAAQSSVPALEGRIHLPSEAYAQRQGLTWLSAFKNEVFRAPHVINWDIIDAMTQFVNWAEERRHIAVKPRRLSVVTTYRRGALPLRRAFGYARTL